MRAASRALGLQSERLTTVLRFFSNDDRLMDKARLLADANPAFAATKEVEQALWKPCVYKRIEDFRRRIRKVRREKAVN